MRLSPFARLSLVASLISLGNLACKPSEPTPDGGACSTAADCAGEVTACTEHACVDGACRVQPKAAGARLEAQTAGDCRVAVCNGNGGVTSSVDDTDLPVDGVECTRDVCTVGTPSNPPAAADTACGMNGALTCDGQGRCVACQSADDCSMGTACQVRTCTAGVCGFDNVAAGTRLATQTAGDCQVSQCDGQGAVAMVADNADVPVDGVECTQDVCTAGVPSNPPVTTGTSCTENDGSRCDATGACVQCVVAADCPGIDTECQARTCTAGVCGRSFTADGTAVSSQTANDCRRNVCDGQGRVVNRADNADLPNDNNACTTDTCSAGAPVFSNRASGDSCGTDLICDGAGACVGCNTASDCPGTDSACSTRTCVNNVCGRNNAANNTATATQVPNDCRKTVCDGMGNIVTQNDDTDVPADDGNECTSQSCNAGTPVFPPRALNSACSQNDGSFCNAAGACVQCNAATQCAGTDGECSTRTCVSGACGVTVTPSGTPTATQAAGDCQQRQCAGDGGVISVAFNTDLPADDGNSCTGQTCVNGAPAFPPVAIDTPCAQGSGTRCNATGTCVQCNTASQCAGTDTACQTRTCSAAGACGVSNVAAGTAIAAQVAGDCKEARCNGTGTIVQVNVDTDVPADDGNECTAQSCTAGTPTFPAVTPGATCTANGGGVCSGTSCVECRVANDCPGSDTECSVRTCVNNACGRSFMMAGTVTTAQTAGDCQQNQCDGAGGIVSVARDQDVPAEDGNQCTAQSCVNGTPTFAAVAPGSPCTANDGTFCSGTTCVQCNVASDCSGSDDECSTRTCTAGTCGRSYTAAGFPVASQVAGDCKQNQCDGAGNIVAVNRDQDVPADDGNQCTDQACVNGTPTFAAVTPGTTCTENGGTFCSGTSCVSCSTADDCAGTDNECSVRACNAGVCSRTTLLAAGTVVSAQTAGDCQQNRCDANGMVVSVNFDSDVPASDGNDCTNEQCNAGVPSSPFVPADTSCGPTGTQFCTATGQCVQCNEATQCAGTDNECQARTCSSNSCGFSFTPQGVQVQAQTSGDCKVNQCNGAGGTETVNADSDVPVDGNQCTDDQCNAGVASNPARSADLACNENGGTVCDGSGACVQCNSAAQCPAGANECQVAACTSNACGFTNVPSGTATASQTAGNCKQGQCDGNGAVVQVNFDTDLPVDNNQCTADVCTAGTATNPPVALGVACNQNGGDACNGTGTCVASPVILSASPANLATGVNVRSSIAVTFSKAMNPATLTVQSASGACSGSVQLSRDNFTTCLGLTALVGSAGATVFTTTAVPGLSYGGVYALRVTTAVQDTLGLPMRNQFSMVDGFTMAIDGNDVVISQIYPAGGNSNASYNADFIELHNRGTTSISLAGMSLQWVSATNANWAVHSLPSVSLLPGQYFLAQVSGTGTTGSALPTPDSVGTNLTMGASSGKVALVAGTAALTAVCPTTGVLDMVGYGTTPNCFEGAGRAPVSGAATSIARKTNGCVDANDNATDFATGAVTPRNTGSTVLSCVASTVNESGLGAELDYCNLQSPTSLTVTAGGTTPTVYAQAYEYMSTEAAGPSTNLQAQIGVGPVTSNPQWQGGWTWTNATFNTNQGNNDEWQATITAPSTVGTYRYTARFSYDGVQWTYCDLNGAGSNSNLVFETAQLPTLTVQ